MTQITALVLGGGGPKIFYEAGVCRALFRLGVRPDYIYGTSAGALCTAYFAAHQPDDPADWPAVGEAFVAFLLSTVTHPGVVATPRPWYELVYRVAFSKWDGVVDTAPLAHLLERTLGDKLPRTGRVVARVSAVNLRTGKVEYHGSDEPTFLHAVLASTAEPVTMPIRYIGPDPYGDGGVRDIVAPLRRPIMDGATRIYPVVCQPDGAGEVQSTWGKVTDLIGRYLTINSDESVAADLRRCQEINAQVADGRADPGKRHVGVTVIRPQAPLPIDFTSFKTAAQVVAMGDADAVRALRVTGGGLPSLPEAA